MVSLGFSSVEYYVIGKMWQFYFLGFCGGSASKESACCVGDVGSIPVSGKSLKEGNSNLLQYSCLENPVDGGAWQVAVHGIARVRHDLALSFKL